MAAIVAGAVLGMLAKKGIPHRVEESLTRIQGLAVGLIGLNGVIASMFTVDADGGISDSGGLLLLVSLVLGCQAGELLRIDDREIRPGFSFPASPSNFHQSFFDIDWQMMELIDSFRCLIGTL